MRRCFLFTLIFLSKVALGVSYNLADLRALSDEGSYGEFLNHALDIRPSERADEWKTMVGKMALKFAHATLNESTVPRKSFLRMEELYRWPSLRQDDVFRSRRVEVGMKYLKNCLVSPDPCWNDLTAFWKEDSSDPDMAIKLAEIIKDRSESPFTVWSLLEKPLLTPFSEFYCRKPFVMKALWDKLNLDYLKLTKESKFLSKIEETIHADCLPSLVEEARKRVYQPESEGDRELSFEILTSVDKADRNLQDFFYTLYLLEHPSQGEMMNIAWNTLTELGKNPARRDSVMSLMKNLDPLPDAIMGSLDLAKKRVVLRHFKTNFPEYFDYYSQQCVAYYSGSQKFSKGNPTMKCQDLMNSDLASEILPESKIQQFRKVKNI